LSDSCTQTLSLTANYDDERHAGYEEDLAAAVGRVNTQQNTDINQILKGI
jgi:hypothetical protein